MYLPINLKQLLQDRQQLFNERLLDPKRTNGTIIYGYNDRGQVVIEALLKMHEAFPIDVIRRFGLECHGTQVSAFVMETLNLVVVNDTMEFEFASIGAVDRVKKEWCSMNTGRKPNILQFRLGKWEMGIGWHPLTAVLSCVYESYLEPDKYRAQLSSLDVVRKLPKKGAE